MDELVSDGAVKGQTLAWHFSDSASGQPRFVVDDEFLHPLQHSYHHAGLEADGAIHCSFCPDFLPRWLIAGHGHSLLVVLFGDLAGTSRLTVLALS